MKVKVRHEGTIVTIQWWPTDDVWNTWTVTKMLDLDTMKPMDAFASISSPLHFTAKSMRRHIHQLELAMSIAQSLDKAIGDWNAAKVLREEIDILPTPYSEWPYQDPILVSRNRETKRVEIKYQESI